MALTQDQRTALLCARQYIEEGREIYLCFALNCVEFRYPKLKIAVGRLKAYIRLVLGPFATLDEWIVDHERKKPAEERRFTWTPAQRREARIQWIDWMLDEPKEA